MLRNLAHIDVVLSSIILSFRFYWLALSIVADEEFTDWFATPLRCTADRFEATDRG